MALAALFFLSGFAALVYQVVWQRTLFAIYGINIESVTVVVTAFMLGLGLGSLAGGAISKDPQRRVVAWFGAVELAIGVFGLLSLPLFRAVGQATLGLSPPLVALVTFLLVLLPTMLMGGTLPLLVAHFARASRNVGRSVGLLYFINTLGSAFASAAAVFLLLPKLGQTHAVWAAAALNGVASVSAFVLHLRARRAPADAAADAAPDIPTAREATAGVADRARFTITLVLAGAVGAVALSYEILWYRAIAFTSAGRPTAFGMLLAFYLLGVALGSIGVRRFCRDEGAVAGPAADARRLRALSAFVFLAGIAGYLVVPATAWLASRLWVASLGLVTVAAGLLGAVLPLVAHHGIPADDRAGARLSYVYLANIIGSATGSFVTGFVLMDALSTERISTLLALVGFVMVALLILVSRPPLGRAAVTLGGLAMCAAGLAYGGAPLFTRLYDRLFFKTDYPSITRDGKDAETMPGAFREVIENRHGVIAVNAKNQVFGGGAYDGAFNVSLVDDKNAIERAFAICAMHPAPRKVLMIGLSSGSWAQVVAHLPGVEHLTVVEINDGYTGLIAKHPETKSLLTNPKVTITIDDGRRWLLRHPEERFDFIVMNTTFHWRAHITNLLSTEFLELARAHLLPGGVHYFNTTSSFEAQRTAATVFPYALRVENFVAVSDSPIAFDRERWDYALHHTDIDGLPAFDFDVPAQRAAYDKIRQLADTLGEADGKRYEFFALEPRDKLLERTAGARLVTDDDMAAEWEDPLGFLRPPE